MINHQKIKEFIEVKFLSIYSSTSEYIKQCIDFDKLLWILSLSITLMSC